jgi:hypothetical protein
LNSEWSECDLKKREKNSASEDCHEQQSSQDFCQEGFIRCELRLSLSGKLKIGHGATTELGEQSSLLAEGALG